jgi:hypothetical protein
VIPFRYVRFALLFATPFEYPSWAVCSPICLIFLPCALLLLLLLLLLQEWTGQQLAECSLYGIRVYPEGAVLATHVDRLPLVASAIINVDQDVDEPWPLEVIGHDGKAHNVTMVPGDLVLCT